MLKFGYRGGVPGWYSPSGSFMPIIAGAAPDSDSDSDSGDDSSDGDDDGDSDADEDSEEDESEEDDGIRDPKAKLAAEAQKNERLTKRLKDRDKTIDELSARLKKIEDEGKSEDEKREGRLQELENSDKSKDEQIKLLTSVNRLLANPDIAKLPEARRSLLIRMLEGEVVIDEDGEDNIPELVDGMKEKDPILFSIGDESDDDDSSDKNGSKKRPSGKPVGGKKRKDKNQVDDAELLKRFPAIKR